MSGAGSTPRARALELARGALAAIEAARPRIDDLNVYPVPDGDTGTNLTLTVRAVVEALEGEGPDDRAALAHEVSRAALMGARGNSGVILSQIVRGATDALSASDDVAVAFRSASDAAYRAVRKPVEGTMLTAIRRLADAAEKGLDLVGIVAAGDVCVEETREMLPVLREAGVVDAGAAGLVEIVRGVAASVTGAELPAVSVRRTEPTLEAAHVGQSRYRYCTVVVVEGDDLDAPALESELEPLGDSLLVVGDRSALKVHVHTDDPGRVLSLAVARGTIDGVEIANMQEQAERRTERILHAVPDTALVGLVAVAVGEGNRRLFESLGARVVDGGATMNPSTADLLAAVDAGDADAVVVLPNSGNVVMAAEQAAANAAARAAVVPTRSLQAGLAAAVAFDPTAPLEANLAAMGEAAGSVGAGAVARASRDVELDGVAVRSGDWLGLVDGAPVAGGTFDDAAAAVVGRLLAEPRGLLTLLTGEEAPGLDALLASVRASHPAVEVEVHPGGQPHYALLVAAE